MPRPRDPLPAIVRKHLMPEFGKHARNGLPYDPWYWGLPPSNRLEDWALVEGEEAIFRSLTNGKKPKNNYEGFCGTLAACPNCICVLGERPSKGEGFGKSVGKIYPELLNLISWSDKLRPLCQKIGIDLPLDSVSRGRLIAHVTDLIKFRGEELKSPPLSDVEIRISAECLHDELELLRPSIVLVTRMAADALQDKDISSIMWSYAGVRKWILSHPLAIEVPHWSQSLMTTWFAIVIHEVDRRLTRHAEIRAFLDDHAALPESERFDYAKWRNEIKPVGMPV